MIIRLKFWKHFLQWVHFIIVLFTIGCRDTSTRCTFFLNWSLYNCSVTNVRCFLPLTNLIVFLDASIKDLYFLAVALFLLLMYRTQIFLSVRHKNSTRITTVIKLLLVMFNELITKFRTLCSLYYDFSNKYEECPCPCVWVCFTTFYFNTWVIQIISILFCCFLKITSIYQLRFIQ